ncbi:MAG TPA: hypothetical protein VF941_01415 [Clostridia bacterium]
MRKFYITLLLGLIMTVSMFFPGCSSIGNVINQNKVRVELKVEGGVHFVLTPKNIKEEKPSKNQYEAAIAIMDYRLKNIGCDKRSIIIDDSGNIVVDIVYTKASMINDVQLEADYAVKPGLFTIQEVDESRKDDNGTYLPTDKVIVNGNDVKDAKAMDDKDKGINIMVELTDKASKDFEEATGRLIGKPLGIFIDNQMISAPVVQAKITGGKLVISEKRNKEQALNLITIIKSGALPFKLEPTIIKCIPAMKK